MAGGWARREIWTILGNYQLIEMQRSNQNCFHSPVQWWWETLTIDCPNSQTISCNKKARENNCSSIFSQGSNWHLNKLNARSDSMIPNLFWINSGEALIGSGSSSQPMIEGWALPWHYNWSWTPNFRSQFHAWLLLNPRFAASWASLGGPGC